ncbi:MULTISPECIES: hypothetical protein [unclassified Beijerinckia]|uniref:hypothetical protein n=1 Tax=unclassified Beijerinckia TaxID=2638183 RepID=UPI0011150437|nr:MULTISPECIES: hypothetical protein [unclassified Beijerinckia]MDH7799746.1 hypothetical protein [Beijerinckia sp. GAS462]
MILILSAWKHVASLRMKMESLRIRCFAAQLQIVSPGSDPIRQKLGRSACGAPDLPNPNSINHAVNRANNHARLVLIVTTDELPIATLVRVGLRAQEITMGRKTSIAAEFLHIIGALLGAVIRRKTRVSIGAVGLRHRRTTGKRHNGNAEQSGGNRFRLGHDIHPSFAKHFALAKKRWSLHVSVVLLDDYKLYRSLF